MKVLVCISGASGVNLGIKLLLNLPNNLEIFAVISQNAKDILNIENNSVLDKSKFKNITFFDNKDLGAPVSSGSFGISKTIIAPCSINTLGKIASGISDNLITRSAAVAIKEKKQLILGVREMPLSYISLNQMAMLSSIGVMIAPPVYANYSDIKSLDDLENFFVGKWLDSLNFEHNLYKKWR
ncbi:UbiX family flavin prenyltransferase [Campylobacter sputorum]|uniref:UbiX family flavin prenyltransferase n=1 Tax=Campylobacter sputorum TaxID=206 RepID=UPI000B76DB56|nr:UbiX family flavin prenyltransferase [Campylobacter sputorum]ASM36997.1 3-octaprenyl-4-hydroxybenzoate carboxy-lyase [Campylobacter sputorum bv. faecalis CCUG 20703]